MFRSLAILGIVVIPALAACADNPALAQALSPQQASLVDATCANIMGLRQGEYYYAMCKESLSRSLAAREEAAGRLSSYDDCRREGLAEGSAALSMCVLEHVPPVRVASAESAAQLAYPHDDPDAGRSYYNVTPATHWRREQYSCAQLGFVPGSSAFTHCVANLDADLLPGLQ